MAEQYLFSTAYLPPVEYFSHLIESDEILIEKHENYIKQTYRNRCYILGSEGPVKLTVPVLLGSFHKVPIKEIRIDYTRRWQQVHLGAIESAYRSSPYFMFYYDKLREVIEEKKEFLIDLNTELLEILTTMAGINTRISFSTEFQKPAGEPSDFRYSVSPKISSDFKVKPYQTVFLNNPDIQGLSFIDLLFNLGPDAKQYLLSENSGF
jgi:hypothetical protein